METCKDSGGSVVIMASTLIVILVLKNSFHLSSAIAGIHLQYSFRTECEKPNSAVILLSGPLSVKSYV